MKKVMPDEDLERILAPKIEEERRQKAQKKARDQLNYERYVKREHDLYEREYNKQFHQSSKFLPLLFIVFVVLLCVFLSMHFPGFEDFISRFMHY